MKKPIVDFFTLLFLSGVVIYLTSCAPAYVPNTLNSPLLSNKGEVQLGINGGLSGFDPEAAYAITDHLGVMLNGSFRNSTSDSSDSFHKHAFVELGSGYFTNIGKVGRFEAYGGYGFCKLKAFSDNGIFTSFADANYNRVFIQPAIGLATPIFDGSFATRIVLVNMIQNDLHFTEIFFEPALTFKVGYKYVKGMMQLGLSLPMGSEGVDFNYQPFIFSFGIQAAINRHYE
jgi:hypothetical protein